MFKHQGKHVHIVVLSDSPNSRIFLYFFCFTRECPDADSLVSRFYFGINNLNELFSLGNSSIFRLSCLI